VCGRAITMRTTRNSEFGQEEVAARVSSGGV
jgi:hypothetical protein